MQVGYPTISHQSIDDMRVIKRDRNALAVWGIVHGAPWAPFKHHWDTNTQAFLLAPCIRSSLHSSK
jgi:hypothetical protein